MKTIPWYSGLLETSQDDWTQNVTTLRKKITALGFSLEFLNMDDTYAAPKPGNQTLGAGQLGL